MNYMNELKHQSRNRSQIYIYIYTYVNLLFLNIYAPEIIIGDGSCKFVCDRVGGL